MFPGNLCLNKSLHPVVKAELYSSVTVPGSIPWLRNDVNLKRLQMATREARSIVHLIYNVPSPRSPSWVGADGPKRAEMEERFAICEAEDLLLAQAKPLALDMHHYGHSDCSRISHLNFSRLQRLRLCLEVTGPSAPVIEAYAGVLGKLLPQLKYLQLEDLGHVALSQVDLTVATQSPLALEELELAARNAYHFDLLGGLSQEAFQIALAHSCIRQFRILGRTLKYLDMRDFEPLTTGAYFDFPDLACFPQLQCFVFRLRYNMSQWEDQLKGLAFPTLKRLVVHPPKLVHPCDYSTSVLRLLQRLFDSDSFLPSLVELDCSSVTYETEMALLHVVYWDKFGRYRRWLAEMKNITDGFSKRVCLTWLHACEGLP